MTFFERRVIEAPPGRADEKPLAVKNAHPKDCSIRFDEPTHTYSVYDESSCNWLRLQISVSGVYKRFCSRFESERVAGEVAKKRRCDPQSPYYWLLQSQPDPANHALAAAAICEAWRLNAERSALTGTLCHAAAELHLNGMDIDSGLEQARFPTQLIESARPLIGATVQWVKHARESLRWTPYRTEYSVFIDGGAAREPEDRALLEAHADLVAGQIDALFQDEDGGIHMVDWKFCKADKLDPDHGSFRGIVPKCESPLACVTDNSYGHYLMQQSMYAFILKKRYGITLRSSRLVHIPTDLECAEAREIPLNLLEDDAVIQMLEHNRV